MNAISLLVRHKTQPGARSAMQQVWEKYVKARAQANPGHLAYFFCFDAADEDGVTAFQVFANEAAKDAFLAGAWYADYLSEVSPFISQPPTISAAPVVWSKNADPSH